MPPWCFGDHSGAHFVARYIRMLSQLHRTAFEQQREHPIAGRRCTRSRLADLGKSRSLQYFLRSGVVDNGSGFENGEATCGSSATKCVQRMLGRAPTPRPRRQPEADLGTITANIEKHNTAEEFVGFRIGNRQHRKGTIGQTLFDDAVDLLAHDLRSVFRHREMTVFTDRLVVGAASERISIVVTDAPHTHIAGGAGQLIDDHVWTSLPSIAGSYCKSLKYGPP